MLTNSKSLISHIKWPINSKTITFVIREKIKCDIYIFKKSFKLWLRI